MIDRNYGRCPLEEAIEAHVSDTSSIKSKEVIKWANIYFSSAFRVSYFRNILEFISNLAHYIL